MASIVETKSVSIRKGNHNENIAFTGVLGEVTADLGYEDKNRNLGTDSNTTLRLHNGVTKGGVPMARADMLNVSTELLAQGRELINDKNLAYSDLSNIILPENPSARNRIKSIMETCGLADENGVADRLETKADVDTSNINTANLTSSVIHDGMEEGDYPLAYASTSNINTANLVNAIIHNDAENGNLPLAYANLSNVDTSKFATSSLNNVSTDNLWKDEEDRDPSVTGTPLARADLSNVDLSSFETQGFGFEKVANKDSVINTDNITQGHYPETQAVVNFVKNLTSVDCVNTSLTNVFDWSPLFYKDEDIIYSYSANTNSSATGFAINQKLETDILLIDDPKIALYAYVESVSSSGAIQSLSFHYNIGQKDLSSIGTLSIKSLSNDTATFTITSTDNGNGTYTYNVDSIITTGSGFLQDQDCIVMNSSNQELGNIAYTRLNVVVTAVDENGRILSLKPNPYYGLTQVTGSSTVAPNVSVTLSSQEYNTNGGPNVLNADLTNLMGMSSDDKIYETNSQWRIRHDEEFPSLTETTIPASQDYNITTNGPIWRALKPLYTAIQNTPSVILKTQFITNSDHTDEPTTCLLNNSDSNLIVDTYEQNPANKYKNYLLLPNHTYTLQILNSNQADNYSFTTGNAGTNLTFKYSLAILTFNLNVQTATLTIESQGMTTKIHNITTGTYTAMITNDSTWTISSSGYADKTGSLTVASGDQTVNVTL